MTSNLHDAALCIAREGFPVLPIRAQGKRPLTRHGVKDATTDPDQIASWWDHQPRANIGIAIPPGFLVVDVDMPDALHQLRAEGHILPASARATTGRGQHLWYSTGLAPVRNRVALFPGIDIRAQGGYVVAPPSIHPSGAVYRWEVPIRPSTIAECPIWLLERLTAGVSPQTRSADDWQRRIAASVPSGQRNQTLAQVAGLLFRRLPADVAAELAYCWAQVKLQPQLPEREVLRTIDSIAGCELRRQEVNR